MPLPIERRKVIECEHGNALELIMPRGAAVAVASIEFPCGCGMKPQKRRKPHKDAIGG